MRESLENVTVSFSVRNIPDFVNADEEDLALFPTAARHKVLYQHPGNGRSCVYLSPFSANEFDDEKTMNAVSKTWDFVEKMSPQYKHSWQRGDILIWDNLAVMHRKAPANEDDPIPAVGEKRMLFRTQCHLSENTRGLYGGSSF